jgi:GT2 family glycosyltransferase
MIDIFVTAYLREHFTNKTLKYLYERTHTPYRLWLIDYGLNQSVWKKWKNKPKFVDKFQLIKSSENLGIHAAWNITLALATEKYFVTSDNDIYVPDLKPDWLSQMIQFMEERPDYGAISMHPHIFVGAAGIDPKDPEDVKERNMCGAVMRIMRTEAVRKAGGWENVIRHGRNHEERTICSRLQTAGYKVGICSRIRAYHPFGDNWGYPADFTPEQQGHSPHLKEYVKQFDQMEAYDEKTWLPK